MTHSAAPFVQTSTPSDSPPTPLTPPNSPASPAPRDPPPTPPTSPDAPPALRERYQLDRVPDDALHARVKTLVGRHNVLTADMLAHLAEVDARGIYRERACSSLYAYCVYELRFSEDEAQRRSQAARTARKFPTLFEMLAQGAIHMTGLLLLAPHLTTENCTELLARARFRTKREIERLVAEVAPRADVPARIEPLGPSGKTITNLWQAYTAPLRGRVRELESGTARGQAPAPVFDESGQPAMSDLDEIGHGDVPEKSPAPARNETPFRAIDSEPVVPLRYRIEFTIGQEGPSSSEQSSPARRGTTNRHIPVVMRRHVWARDGGRCTFSDANGRRCHERSGLEVHHELAFALGGFTTVENLRLLCRAHNALFAERDFGHEHIERMRNGRRPT